MSANTDSRYGGLLLLVVFLVRSDSCKSNMNSSFSSVIHLDKYVGVLLGCV